MAISPLNLIFFLNHYGVKENQTEVTKFLERMDEKNYSHQNFKKSSETVSENKLITLTTYSTKNSIK